MPNSTTITETTATAAANLTTDPARNSPSDWLEGSPLSKNDRADDDKGAQDAFTELKQPLIPRVFPVYAFI